MNILYLTPDFNYGDGRSYYVYLLLKYFQKAGNNVYLCTNKGDSFDRLTESGIQIFKLTSLSGKLSFIKSVNQIARIIKQYHINILHSHHRYFELMAVSAAMNKNVHTVFTALSLVDRRYFIEYRSEKIIAVSNSVLKMLTETFNVDQNKIALIPNFVDSEEAEHGKIKQSGKKISPVFHILSVGRFHKEKNYETLLEAVSLIKDTRIKITLIGEGKELDDYRRIAEERKLDIEFVTPCRNLKAYFDRADINILTSVRDPMPGFMLQSGLHGKPFIGTDIDGIREVIIDGVTGLLFQKKNAPELSEKIKIFINDKVTSVKCAENLNKLILQNYTEKSIIPQIANIYQGFQE